MLEQDPDPESRGESEAPGRSRPSLATWVAVAQLAGSVAVILSLVYVASEFRRSQALSSSQIEDRLYARVLEMNRMMIEVPELASIVSRANRAEELSPSDSLRFLAFEHIWYDSWETAYDGFHDDILEAEAWGEWDDWFVQASRQRPRAGWVRNRMNFTGDFGRYVDGILADSVTD